MMAEFIVDATTWFIKFLFWFGLIPQLLLNYQRHSTRGISHFMLWGYFNGYLTATYYVYCLDLPLAYKVMVPLSFLTVSVMVIQRFVYDKDFGARWYYLSSLLLGSLALPFTLSYTVEIGHIFGWLSVMIWAMYQFPQIVKIYFEKTVAGFSFLLVSAIGIGNLVETGMSFWFGFPTQSILSGIRGIIVYAIFCAQFFLYRHNAKLSTSDPEEVKFL